MLRITLREAEHPPAILKIEGNLTGGWAALLEQECIELLHPGGAVIVELADVPLVDRAGVEALERLSRAGVEIRCPPGAVASVLESEGVRILGTEEGDDPD